MGRSTHLDPLRWIADHQMHVEVSLGQIFAHARDDRGANREVGHEVAVLEGSREGGWVSGGERGVLRRGTKVTSGRAVGGGGGEPPPRTFTRTVCRGRTRPYHHVDV